MFLADLLERMHFGSAGESRRQFGLGSPMMGILIALGREETKRGGNETV